MQDFRFDLLPKDILLLMLEFLPKEAVVALCSTDRKLKIRCDQIEAQKQALKRIAPFAKPTYTISEQLHLIDRGFTTVYNAEIYRRGFEANIVIGDVYFGFPFREPYDQGIEICVFEIIGLPPPSGTKVFIMGYVGEIDEMNTWRSTDVMVFESKDKGLDFVLDNLDSTSFGTVAQIHDLAIDSLIERHGYDYDISKMIQDEMTTMVESLRGDHSNSSFVPMIFHEVTLP